MSCCVLVSHPSRLRGKPRGRPWTVSQHGRETHTLAEIMSLHTLLPYTQVQYRCFRTANVVRHNYYVMHLSTYLPLTHIAYCNIIVWSNRIELNWNESQLYINNSHLLWVQMLVRCSAGRGNVSSATAVAPYQYYSSRKMISAYIEKKLKFTSLQLYNICCCADY